jgi:hypothetical protein
VICCVEKGRVQGLILRKGRQKSQFHWPSSTKSRGICPSSPWTAVQRFWRILEAESGSARVWIWERNWVPGHSQGFNLQVGKIRRLFSGNANLPHWIKIV